MRKLPHFVLLLTVVLSCLAKDSNKKSLTVRAVASTSRTNERTSAYTTPGRANTNCAGTGTTVSNTTTATANCQTTSTPAQTHQITSITTDVTNTVEADGIRYTIACKASWSGSNCGRLTEGDFFQAEIDDRTMWLVVRKGGNQGKEVRVKNSILDIRPAPTSAPDARPGSSPLSTSSGSDLQDGNVTGTFGGIVRNETVGVSAHFGVAIREEDGVVYGCIAIQQPLYGSGSLQGVLQGSKVSFESVGFSLGTRFSIRFRGELHGAELKGTYEVSLPARQDGEFELTKRGADAPRAGFNLKGCINSLSSF
jgi:hypothetical protein